MGNDKKLVSVVVRRRNAVNSRKVRDICSVMRNESRHASPSDVLGSYTGTPVDDCRPEQDADDL